MEWSDQGIVLAARRHGESSAVLSLLTAHHGRHLGLVRGGSGRRQRPILQPGNQVSAVWRARLADHLGGYQVEPVRLWAADLLDDPSRLACLRAITALLDGALAEREPHPALFDGLCIVLSALSESADWAPVYVRFELGLLGELGYGLDLGRCAVTGATTGLTHVSPRTGRAVCAEAAAPYGARLLALPGFLVDSQSVQLEPIGMAAVLDGLMLTGHFLERQIARSSTERLPAARNRFIELLTKLTTTSSVDIDT